MSWFVHSPCDLVPPSTNIEQFILSAVTGHLGYFYACYGLSFGTHVGSLWGTCRGVELLCRRIYLSSVFKGFCHLATQRRLSPTTCDSFRCCAPSPTGAAVLVLCCDFFFSLATNAIKMHVRFQRNERMTVCPRSFRHRYCSSLGQPFHADCKSKRPFMARLPPLPLTGFLFSQYEEEKFL